MKLIEINESDKPGVFVGVKLSDESKQDVVQYLSDNDIPNRVPPYSLHVTLLYSRKHLPDYTSPGKFEKAMDATPIKFDIFPSSDKKENCLVLLLDCPELVKRHKLLMKEHGATFDYDEYKPHLTFSYDVGDLDISKLQKFTSNISLDREYKRQLIIDS